VLPTPGPGLVSAGEVEAPPDRNGRELGRTKHDGLVRRAAGSAPSRFMSEQPVHGRGSPSLLVCCWDPGDDHVAYARESTAGRGA
jgi:hypothetical protein